MSDDKSEIFESHPFHPTDPPHGLRNFDLGTLGKDQQCMLNEMKTRQRIENEIYLKAHPEVRGLTSILLRHLLKNKPERDIHETVGSFFNKPRVELVDELLDYFDETGYSGSVVENLRKEVAKSASMSSSEFDRSTCTGSSSSSGSSI